MVAIVRLDPQFRRLIQHDFRFEIANDEGYSLPKITIGGVAYETSTSIRFLADDHTNWEKCPP